MRSHALVYVVIQSVLLGVEIALLISEPSWFKAVIVVLITLLWTFSVAWWRREHD